MSDRPTLFITPDKKNNLPEDYDPRKHNYYQPLMDFAEKHNLTAGQVASIDICHDDWCAVYKRKYCNCAPVIRFHKDK